MKITDLVNHFLMYLELQVESDLPSKNYSLFENCHENCHLFSLLYFDLNLDLPKNSTLINPTLFH